MAQYYIQPELDALEHKLSLLKIQKRKIRNEVSSFEHEKLLASYLVIEICSGFESALKGLLENLVNNSTSPQGLKTYVKNSRAIPSADYKPLCELLSKIDGRQNQKFKGRVHTQERDALISLYANRQRIVHYSESQSITATYLDIETWYKQSKRVIKKFETVLRSALR